MVGQARRGWLCGLALIAALWAPEAARADLLVREILIPYEKGSEAEKHSSVVLLYGILNGVFGANEAEEEWFGKRGFCFSDLNALGAQSYFALLSDYARAHPDARDMNAGLVLARAMAERYPCPR